jgi:Outer membrane protein beta-barrel domain
MPRRHMEMRNSLAVVSLFAAISVAPALLAQEEPSRLELYGGYDYVRFNINTNVSGQPPSQTFNGNGGGGELMYNVSNWLGILGDTGGYWATSSTRVGVAGAAIPYLFGPRVSFRRRVVTPFVQVLVGGVATSSGIEQSGWQSHFAMTAGGGVDVRVSKHFSIRPVQAEYFLTKIPDGLNNRQNNFRFGAGIVFRFG